MTRAIDCAPTDEAIAGFWAAVDAGEPIVLVHPRATEQERARVIAAAARLPAGAIALTTSGTTGAPKLVTHTRASLDAAARSVEAALATTAADRWGLALPWSGTGGLMVLVRARRAGLPVVLAPLGEGGEALHARLVRERVTLLSLVPAQLAALVDVGARPPALRVVLVGGEAAPVELVTRARAAGWPVRASYGMTETAGMIALAGPDDPPGAPLALLPGVVVRVDGADDEGVGRLVVHTPAAPAEVITADRGRVDAAGVTVIGRLDDLIIVKGAKIAPREVEDALVASDAIAEALVVACDDGVGALVVAAPGATPRPDEAAVTLAAFKRPRRVLVVAALPRTPAGKLDREAARALLNRR